VQHTADGRKIRIREIALKIFDMLVKIRDFSVIIQNIDRFSFYEISYIFHSHQLFCDYVILLYIFY